MFVSESAMLFLILSSWNFIIRLRRHLGETLEGRIFELVQFSGAEDVGNRVVKVACCNCAKTDRLAVEDLSIREDLVIDDQAIVILHDLIVDEADWKDRRRLHEIKDLLLVDFGLL